MKPLIIIVCLLFSGLAMAASPVGTWKLNDASNTHIKKLNEEQQFLAMMIASAISELKFYNNGKFQAIGTNAQGTWKKEKLGYSWLKIDEDGKKYPAKLVITNAGKLKVTFEKGIYFLYDRKVVTNKDRQDANKIAQIKKIIPYEKMFRTKKKNFMGYFHYLLISRDGTIYTMMNKSGHRITAKEFKQSADIKELLVEQSVRADYTVTVNGIYASTGNNDKIKILSPRQVLFRGETYDIQ